VNEIEIVEHCMAGETMTRGACNIIIVAGGGRSSPIAAAPGAVSGKTRVENHRSSTVGDDGATA
jgi:hypothetical protein